MDIIAFQILQKVRLENMFGYYTGKQQDFPFVLLQMRIAFK